MKRKVVYEKVYEENKTTEEIMKKKYTLEDHLHHVSRHHDTNHSLESVYDLQKRKLTRYLSSVVTTYPTYSTHDTWHSANIVSAIENILGKDRIKKLSGIDTFLILMCAYMHDIGMLYTEEEVRKIWMTKEFQEILEEYRSDESPVGKAAKLLLNAKEENVEESVTWPLDIKQAITIVLMEYFRPQHGIRIQSLTDRANKIGELLCVEDSFLPGRIIKVINKISMAHTGSFENMLSDLVDVDTFAGEAFHPRLIAWLLRMGDLCDLDNDRFNKIGIATFGTLQDDNLAHYFKHCSVETLYISADRIQIIANVDRKAIEQECAVYWMKEAACEDKENFEARCMKVYQQTIREHVNWKSWMESEVNEAKLNVNKIFPKHWSRKIPEIEYRILLNGQEISSGNQNLRFSFSQEKAYSLIENISIYQNEILIFLRELIQNAIDASKIQIWREIGDKIPEYKYEISPFQVERLFPGIFERYAIKIMAKYHEETDSVDFAIEDSGIGISVKEFQEHILKTGNSWRNRKNYKKEFETMPEWLKPTGAFGIGLHTVFTVTDEMKIYTKSEHEEQTNEMVLYSGKKNGYAFCQKSEKLRSRGTRIAFTFHLTQAQKAQCFGEMPDSYLKEYRSEYEKLVINYIEKYCRTPIVPVCFNDAEYRLPALTASTWCNELSNHTDEILKAGLRGQADVNERFEYCFGYDWRYIVIYDKKKHCLLNLRIPSYGPGASGNLSYNLCTQYNALSFMGMHVEDNIDIEENFLEIAYMDILAGEGNAVIDAARMKLTYEAKKQIQTSTNAIIRYARECYLKFMAEQRQDMVVSAYRAGVKRLAEEYYVGNITDNDVWKEMCRRKRLIFPANDSRQVRSLEVRVVTYLMCLNFTDEVLKMDIRSLSTEELTPDAVEMLCKMQIKAFGFLDYLLKKWKSDWRVSSRYFLQPYFDNQIIEILEHYCGIWGQMIIQYVLRKQRINEQEEKWSELLKKEFGRIFPNMCQWKKTKYASENVLMMLRMYRGSSGRTRGIVPALEAVLFPGSAVAFREWNYRGTYIDNPLLSLELDQPYLYLLLDIPKAQNISSLERNVWNLYVRDSIYGAFRYDMISPASLEALIDEKYVIVMGGKNELTYDCIPVLSRYAVTGAEMRKLGLNIRLEAVEKGSQGIRAGKAEKWEIYKRFWRQIEYSRQYEQSEVCVEIPAFDEYREIAEFHMGYDQLLGIQCLHAVVPAWEYQKPIREFMDECNMNAWGPERCVEEIVTCGLDRKVINYLYRTKTDGSVEARERIEKLYRQFLLELFTAWDETMPKG